METQRQLSLSRLNHWLPRAQAHPEVMPGTADRHHHIADALLPEADPIFHHATALHAPVDMRDAQIMDPAAVGVAQQEDDEERIDEQDICDGVVFVLAALTRGLCSSVWGA